MLRPQTQTVDAYEAKAHFSELLAKVESGAMITITRHGAPIAQLVPIRKQYTQQERRAAIEQILELRQRLSLNGLKIRDLIDEGRR